MRWLVGATRAVRQACACRANLTKRYFAEEAVTLKWDEKLDEMAKELTSDEDKKEFARFKQKHIDWENNRSTITKSYSEAPGTLGWDERLDDIPREFTSDEAKREFALFKQAYFDWKNKWDEIMKEPEPIDWEYYKKEVDPELVSMFEEAYKTMPIPKYPMDQVDKAKEMFDELQKEWDAMRAHSAKRMEEITKEIAATKSQMERLATMTVDEALAENPEIAAEIDQEISEMKWF